ncbi:MAG: SpoIIE family protein phosphatase [Pirellulaceae bacterium]
MDAHERTKADLVFDLETLRTQVQTLEASCAKACRALVGAQQRERTLLDTAPEAVVQLDATTGRFMDVNAKAEQLFGLSRDRLLGVGLFDVSPLSQPSRTSRELGCEKIAEALNGGTPAFEWWHVDERGDRFPCEVRFVKLPRDTHQVIQGIITNISSRKRLELFERGRLTVLEQVACGIPLKDTLEKLVRTVEGLLPDMTCSVLLFDSNQHCLRLGAAPNLPDYYNAAVDGLTVGPAVGSCGAAASTGRRIIVSDVRSHPNWAAFRQLADRAHLRACWSEPVLSAASTVLGTFAMYYREPREPVPVELHVIEIAAQLASIAIEHEFAQHSLRTLNETLECHVVEQTRELTDMNRELKAAAEDLRLAAVAFESHDSIMVTDQKGRILRVNRGFTTMTGYTAEEVIGQTPRILKSGRHTRAFYQQMWSAIRHAGYWRGELWNRRKDGHVYPQRLTITSVKNESGRTTHYVGDGHDITEEKQAEADRQAIAVARKVQQDLLPSDVPRVPGFDIAGAAHPADRVSGDYFDFLSLGQNSIGVLVADVCGHGLGAALLMAQTQAYLRALAESLADPGELLTHTNRLIAMGHFERFVTLFLGRLDAESGSFVYASAGHRGYLMSPHGTVKDLESTSMPLGVDERMVVSSAPANVLETGDIIVLPTDGIEETASPGGELFGRQRTLDVVDKNRAQSAAEIVQALHCATRDFADGAPQQDDITVVVLKRLPCQAPTASSRLGTRGG